MKNSLKRLNLIKIMNSKWWNESLTKSWNMTMSSVDLVAASSCLFPGPVTVLGAAGLLWGGYGRLDEALASTKNPWESMTLGGQSQSALQTSFWRFSVQNISGGAEAGRGHLVRRHFLDLIYRPYSSVTSGSFIFHMFFIRTIGFFFFFKSQR